MGDPFTVGGLVRVEALALAVGKPHKALPRAVFTDKTVGQQQQVADLHREHAAVAGFVAQVMADKTPSLPVLGHPGAREVGDPGK